MMACFFTPTPSQAVRLDTAKGRPVANEQRAEISGLERLEGQHYERSYGSAVEVRTGPCLRYNCHGMSFAARRTRIIDNDAIRAILDDDGYDRVGVDKVLPGDVVLYISSAGDIEHSAIVVTPPSRETYNMPKVYSKWGKWKEVIHSANVCPYEPCDLRYYRVRG
ncbi:MAG: hypothetical protein NT025_07105 [bacterium]|nr:hypothetical protein [bacterium]